LAPPVDTLRNFFLYQQTAYKEIASGHQILFAAGLLLENEAPAFATSALARAYS